MVIAGDKESVARKEGATVKEGDTAPVGKYDVGRRLASDNLAESALQVGRRVHVLSSI
jgi:hypothetical protein